MPLRLRLALFGAAVVALTLVLFGALLYALLAHGATTNQDDSLRGRAREAVASLNSSAGITPRAPVAPADLRTSNDVFVEVFDPSWTAIYSTAQLNGSPPIPSARFRVTAAEVIGGSFGTEQGLRLFALPFADNLASRRVLEKAGFTLEGTMRCSAMKDGVVRDQALYARLSPS